MSIAINCPSCKNQMHAPNNLAGRKVKCPKCGQPIAVPAAIQSTPANAAVASPLEAIQVEKVAQPASQIACSHCGGSMTWNDRLAGQMVGCPHCNANLQMPSHPLSSFPPPAVRPVPVAVVYTPPAQVVTVDVAHTEAMKECQFCGEFILAIAKKCKHCGETIDVTLRMAEEAKQMAKEAKQMANRPSPPMVFMNAGGASASASSSSAAAAAASATRVSGRSNCLVVQRYSSEAERWKSLPAISFPLSPVLRGEGFG
ncbi:MAG: hypothetical protein ACYC3I_07690, partial [Gemmataceae bacterium]